MRRVRCLGYFSVAVKTHLGKRNHGQKKGLIGPQFQGTVQPGVEVVVWEFEEEASHMTPAFGRESAMNTKVQIALCFIFIPGPQPKECHCPHLR